MHDVVIPESHHPPTRSLKPTGTPLVTGGLGVLASVCFNDKLTLDTGEVSDEWTDRMLAPEFAAAEATGAKEVPEQTFCVGHMTPQVASDWVSHRSMVTEASEEMVCAKLTPSPGEQCSPTSSACGGGVPIAEAPA